MPRLFVAVAALAAAVAPAAAQSPGMNYMELGAAMQAAQAQAVRPGDESLGCEALEAELVAASADPALQSRVQASAAAAQERAAAAPGASPGAQAAATIFSSLAPGADAVGLAAAAAQAEAGRGQAATNLQDRRQQAQSMMAMLPQMMRGQRVLELAQARNCPWVQGAMPR